MANSLITEKELRIALRQWLSASHDGSAHIAEEFGLENGSSRIDMAVFSDSITGYEIKSDFDNTARLYNQIHSYNRIFDRIYIVTSPVSAKFLDGILPSWWGILHGIRHDNCVVKLTELKKPTVNACKDIYSLLTLLKRQELNDLAQDKQLPKNIINGNKPALLDSLADSSTIEDVSKYVSETVRTRYALLVA
jgi:hypothetical protein